MLGWMGWLVAALVFALGIFLAVDRKAAAFFWLGGLAALAPALNLVRQPIPMTDHYQHWAMWGWCAGVVLAVHGVAVRLGQPNSKMAPRIAGSVAALLGALSLSRVADFHDLPRVLTAAVEKQPGSAWGQASLVSLLSGSADPQIHAKAGPHALRVFQCADASMINPSDRSAAIREARFFCIFRARSGGSRVNLRKRALRSSHRGYGMF